MQDSAKMKTDAGLDAEGGLSRRAVPESFSISGDTINLGRIARRSFPVMAGLAILGGLIGWFYAAKTPVIYRSEARILISPPQIPIDSEGAEESVLSEEVLANHIEQLRGRSHISEALAQHGLIDDPSLVAAASETGSTAAYVQESMQIGRGGPGPAKNARSLLISFDHQDPEVAKEVLLAVLSHYRQRMSVKQDNRLGRANELVLEAQSRIETELMAAETGSI